MLYPVLVQREAQVSGQGDDEEPECEPRGFRHSKWSSAIGASSELETALTSLPHLALCFQSISAQLRRGTSLCTHLKESSAKLLALV